MDRHLSSEELDGVMAGRPEAAAAAEHLGGCARCAADVAELKLLLTGMRETATMAAEQQRRLAVTRERRMSGMARGGIWAGAMAAVLVALIVPAELKLRQAPVTAVTAGPATARVELSDEALLDGVQSDLSFTVPAPMEPLAGTTTTNTNR